MYKVLSSGGGGGNQVQTKAANLEHEVLCHIPNMWNVWIALNAVVQLDNSLHLPHECASTGLTSAPPAHASQPFHSGTMSHGHAQIVRGGVHGRMRTALLSCPFWSGGTAGAAGAPHPAAPTTALALADTHQESSHK